MGHKRLYTQGSTGEVMISLLQWGMNIEDEMPESLQHVNLPNLIFRIEKSMETYRPALIITDSEAKALIWLHKMWGTWGKHYSDEDADLDELVECQATDILDTKDFGEIDNDPRTWPCKE